IVVDRSNLKNLIHHHGNIVAVGTTSMRSLESLYWYGVKLLKGMATDFFIPKLYPYEDHGTLPGLKRSFQAVLEWMDKNDYEGITGNTEIMIMPGYEFKVCNG